MQDISGKDLDQIIKNTVSAMEQGKEQIYEIYKAARQELDQEVKRSYDIKASVREAIALVERLEEEERRARRRLVRVSSDFSTYSEADIKECYNQAKDVQVRLAVAREKERSLRRQRDEQQLRLRQLQNIVGKAEKLVSQVGVVLGYLGGELGEVASQIESIQQQKALGIKVIQVQEEERRRVAREIHDGPAQLMANLVFRAEVCERLLELDRERAKRELQELRGQVRDCLREVRKIIFDLRPMTLDDLGLVPTVHRFIEALEKRCAITVDFNVHGEPQRLEAHLEIALFRIIQEALNNVEKHAGATRAKVIIEFARRAVTLAVEDNGRGFEIGAGGNEGAVIAERYGLIGMGERAKLIRGEFKIQSKPGRGTKVRMVAPLAKEGEAMTDAPQ